MALQLWIIVILSILLFLTAAKTHGRQLRLERELHGYMEVQFGTGTNPAWVEAFWRRDRIRFWTLVGVLAPLTILWAALPMLDASLLPLARHAQTPRLAFGLVAPLLWAPTLAFLLLASLSLVRLRQAKRGPDPQIATQPPRWHRDARRGSLFWFLTAAALALSILALTLT